MQRHEAWQEIEERWRRWAGRPPELSPAEAAAAVTARLEAPLRRGSRPRWLAAAAVVLALVGGAQLLHRTEVAPTVGPEVATLAAEPALGSGQVLIWLDEETPLYMTFQPPQPGGEEAQP